MWRVSSLAFVLALSGVAFAADPPSRTRVIGKPLTAMAAGVLAQADRIVVGRVLEVRTRGKGLQIARIGVDRTLEGEKGASLTVFVGGPRPTDDKSLPSVPYLTAHPTRRSVLFLARRGKGEAWRLVTAISAEGDIGKEKARILERHIELARIVETDTRARRTRDFLIESLAGKGTWTRVHAARELHHLLSVYPITFDAASIERIEAAARKVRLPAQRKWLTKLLERLECAPPAPQRLPEPPGATELRTTLGEAPTEDGKVEVLRAALERSGTRGLGVVLRVLQGETPAIRIRVIDLLAAGGWHAVVPAIRGLYAQEESADVQRAIVRAVGRLGGQPELTWLVQRTGSLRVRREALLALARLRSPEARESLEKIRERLRKEGDGAEDFVALIDYLLGPAFERIERTRGRVPR